MSRNGSGVYSLPAGSTVSNGDTSDATDLNTPLSDLEADANTARPIVAGGTGATSVGGAQTALKIAPTDSTATITGTWTYTGTLDVSGGTLTLPDDVVATAKIADDAVTLAKIADANLAGADSTLLTGTAGTDGNLAQWNADGDLVDGPGELTQDQVEDDTDTTFGTVSGERLSQAVAANAPLTKEYESSQFTPAASTLTTLAHGLGETPKIVNWTLICTTAEHGFSIGDVVGPITTSTHMDADTGVTPVLDSTNIEIYPGGNFLEKIINKSGSRVNLTFGNWDMIVRAYA